MTRPGSAALPLLVVDDDDANRAYLRLVMEHAGFRVVEAADGPSALAAMAKDRPAAIVLDYMMPGMTGPEVLHRIRANGALRHLPVVLLTTSDHPDHIGAAFDAGADDYVTRPIDRRILLSRIKAVVEMHRRRLDSQVQARIRQDLDEARRVQRAGLPSFPAEWPGWRAHGGVVSSGAVGGDFISRVDGPDGSTTWCLVDVSGHGLGAALVAAEAAAELRSLLMRLPPDHAIGALGDCVSASRAGKHVCVAAVRVHRDGVTVVNAGLPPVVLERRGRSVARFASSGSPPGLLPAQCYRAETTTAEVGDRIWVVSDGATEPFGFADDVEACIARLRARLDEGVEAAVVDALASTGRPARDDATALVLERVR